MIDSFLGRLTCWLLRHRWYVLAFWLLLAPLFVYGFLNVSRKLLTIVMTRDDAQSTFVFRAKAKRFTQQSQFGGLITLHTDRLKHDDEAYEKTAKTMHDGLRKLPCIKGVVSLEELPLMPDLFVSKDGHSMVSIFEMEVGYNDYIAASRCVTDMRREIRRSRSSWAVPDLEVLVTGGPAIDVDIGRLTRRDSERAELIAAVVSLILLVWMFRSASAAFLPLITASLGVTGSMMVVFFVADYVELSLYVSVISSMAGLGLGLDYALLYVSRFREEREAGRDPVMAIGYAAGTAGKAILGSGILVMMGFAGLLIPELQFPRSVGLGGILAVFFTLCTTLTLLPVLLSFWHPTMNWPRWRWFRASHERVDRFWDWWSRSVLKIPIVLLLLGLTVVGLCGPHLFDLKVRNPRHESIPMALESRRGLERFIQIHGENKVYRIEVVVEIRDGGTWKDVKRQKLLIGVLDKIRAFPEVDDVKSADMMTRALKIFGFAEGFASRYVSKDGKLVSMDIYGKDGSDDFMNALVAKLRRELPRMVASDPGLKTYVGGKQATFYETTLGIKKAIPLMFPILGVCAFLFMALFFRSVVIPAKALLLNALSLFSTFGILVLVFQHGWGLWLLGYHGAPPGALSVATPILLFGIVFGVSMDYEVFLMSRIQEAYRRRVPGATTRAEREEAHTGAIHEGLSRTGGIITNAAAIMVITFAAFISGTVMPMKEMGFALALAVALDATLVRMMLVPSVLKLLGSRTWYWPWSRERDQK